MNVPSPLRVLDDSLFAMNLALIVGHSDPIGHHPPRIWQDGPAGSVISHSDKVGGSFSLKKAAQEADLFVVAAGAAKHAATEFIDANRRSDLDTAYAKGKGSASMLRAISEWVQTL